MMITKFTHPLIILMLLLNVIIPIPVSAAPHADHDSTASGLRMVLASQMGEHVLLAASATNAALGGRTTEFEAAAAALDANSTDLADTIGLVYGNEARDTFLALWRVHIGFFVDYTQAVGANDQAKKAEAVQKLIQYGQEFGAFLESANPNLPQETVAELLGSHVATLTGVIDAQAAGDQVAAYTAMRDAFAHMDMIAVALAGGIVKQYPDRFAGSADSSAAALRTLLNLQLREHAYLAAAATNAALAGRMDEFDAAVAALDANSIDLANSIGSVYGDEAKNTFLTSWRTHIGFFVEYTMAVAAGDQAKQDQVVQNLLQYAGGFGILLNSLNSNLPQETVAELVSSHVTTLIAVIDAQGAGDYGTAYTALREAYNHMAMIANPLAAATVQMFPETFNDNSSSMMAASDSSSSMMAAVACEQNYMVQADDWLSKLADKFYGDVLAYPAIVEATNAAAKAGNYNMITNPDIIEVGWLLCIPNAADLQMLLQHEMMGMEAMQ